MKEFIFEVERRVYGWMKDRLSIEAETPEEALEKLKEMAEDGTKNGWDEDRVGLESSKFDYYEVEYPTVEENKGATIFISHLDSCLGWDNPIGEDSGRERKYDSQY